MVDRGDGLGDTTYTKIFVGGLAWETRRDTMRHYFEQFGEILEAVVIFDKNTGKSKGYGFVTFRDPESARKACENPYPVIDGRRANCNLASLGAQKNRPAATTSLLQGTEKFRQKSASSGFNGNSAYFHRSIPQNEYPYSPGYAAYSQDYYPMNYYNVYNGQQYSPYYPPGSHGFYLNYYPVYAQHGTTSGAQYPKLMQYPIIPQQFRVLPTSASTFASITALPSTATIAPAVPGQTPNTSEPNPSST